MRFLKSPPRWFLIFEWSLLFVATPLLLFDEPTRLKVHAGLWLVCLYALWLLSRDPDFSWKDAWRGRALTRRELKGIAARFAVSTVGIILLTMLLNPERLFSFPLQRPGFWLIVMLLYPILSALPQELIFRTFFFRRYRPLFTADWAMALASSFAFGFVHIVFHNPVSPILSFVCGFFLCSSTLAHRSLKRAAIEHAIYGDMVFTIGLGLYFVIHPI